MMSNRAAPEFQKLVTIANRVAAKFNRSRDTWILTSFALDNVLQRLGFDSRPLRIEAAVFPDDRKFYGTILGGAFSTVGWPSTSTSNAKETPCHGRHREIPDTPILHYQRRTCIGRVRGRESLPQ
jgi:hypothetical protein